jgi:hypothetical protein
VSNGQVLIHLEIYSRKFHGAVKVTKIFAHFRPKYITVTFLFTFKYIRLNRPLIRLGMGRIDTLLLIIGASEMYLRRAHQVRRVREVSVRPMKF